MPPLPALPPSNTARVYLSYTSMQRGHTFEARPFAGSTEATYAALCADIAAVLKLRMRADDAITKAEFSVAGSNVRFPLPFTAVQGTISPTGIIMLDDPESVCLSITGKSSGQGRKWRLSFFSGVANDSGGRFPATNRYLPGASAVIDTFRINLQNIINSTSPSGTGIAAIDGTTPYVNQYVNIGRNAYWQRKQRGGG
mgnify:CR=1 FL=1